MSSSLYGSSSSDAVTDPIYDVGERPAGKSEWEDALIKHNIIPTPSLPPLDEDDISTITAEYKQNKNKWEEKSLEQLEQAQEEAEDDEERVIQQYRARRLAELSALSSVSRYSGLVEIGQTDFVAQVTEASNETTVIVLLSSDGKVESDLLTKHLSLLADKVKTVKFVKIKSTDAIPNFPDRNTPTLLIYKNSNIIKQFIGIEQFGGRNKISPESIEFQLAAHNIIESNIKQDPTQTRISIKRGKKQGKIRQFNQRNRKEEEDDDDDDADDD